MGIVTTEVKTFRTEYICDYCNVPVVYMDAKSYDEYLHECKSCFRTVGLPEEHPIISYQDVSEHLCSCKDPESKCSLHWKGVEL